MKMRYFHAAFLLLFYSLSVEGTLSGHAFSRASSRIEQKNRESSFSPYNYHYIGNSFGEDSVMIYALRIEFKPDSATHTTGNGLFFRSSIADQGITSSADRKEFAWYKDGTYKYDRLPHDSLYFSEHLTSLRKYYLDVSKEKLRIGYTIFPNGDYGSYQLEREMSVYSPGIKRNDETFDEFSLRRARMLMKFVEDAILKADSSAQSPFSSLVMNHLGQLFTIDQTTNDSTKVFIMLVHAGASVLTDGGTGGAANANSQSDLTDAFINEEQFTYFNSPHENIFDGSVIKDPISGIVGLKINGKNQTPLVLSELMMLSETSNQDSLNWGINGIVVNQFARQLGIPDLYAKSSGITGIGSFGVMDFAGYSAAQGFIPPNPSAWVRAYMGWDTPYIASADNNHQIRAFHPDNDSTLFLVPINSQEYWLVENRQRNLSEDDLFLYDTTDGIKHISATHQINLDVAINETSSRGVVMTVRSRDIGIPGSGACLWHIDEEVIKNRISRDMINIDSSYRGVSLEEADGVMDIGVEFTDALGYPWFDYGSAEDVFPHHNSFHEAPSDTITINAISPYTSPATKANDGGHTYKTMKFTHSKEALTDNSTKEVYHFRKTENTKYEDYYVTNYPDSLITLRVGYDPKSPTISDKWPVKLETNRGLFPLLSAEIIHEGIHTGNSPSKEIVVLDSSGNVFICRSNGSVIPLGTSSSSPSSKTDSIDGAFTMPTMVGTDLWIPTMNSTVEIYSGSNGTLEKKTLALPQKLTSWITAFGDSSWYVGTKTGTVLFGTGNSINDSILIDTTADSVAICGISLIDTANHIAAAVSQSGIVGVIQRDSLKSTMDIKTLSTATFYPPLRIISGDLDKDGSPDIIVSDQKQGLWFLTCDSNGENIRKQSEIPSFPNDWAGVFRSNTARADIPSNGGFLSLADINDDGLIELLVPGTNGVYAFNHRGVLIDGWPALLDRANWEIRKSVIGSPLVIQTLEKDPLVLFSVPTGDHKTYYQTTIDSAHIEDSTVYFHDIDGNIDSINGLSPGFIDTLLNYNDSLILPYFSPGGLIDARDQYAQRPDSIITTNTVGEKRFSPWPISVGGHISTSPLWDDLDNDSIADLIAVSDAGYLYRWEIPNKNLSISSLWPMTGGSPQRQFMVRDTAKATVSEEILSGFYSYPNPIRVHSQADEKVTFRYRLGTGIQRVSLSIYTMAGMKIFESHDLPTGVGLQEFVYTDLSRYGSAVYRCRLAVTTSDGESVQFWKMALLRGVQK